MSSGDVQIRELLSADFADYTDFIAAQMMSNKYNENRTA
jgi:hypothetical protein